MTSKFDLDKERERFLKDENAPENYEEFNQIRSEHQQDLQRKDDISDKYFSQRQKEQDLELTETIKYYVGKFSEQSLEEQRKRNVLRIIVLVVISGILFWLMQTTFSLIQKNTSNITEQMQNIIIALISSLSVNLIGLLIIGFKYLFPREEILLKKLLEHYSEWMARKKNK